MNNTLNTIKMKNLNYNTMKKVFVVLFVALTMIGCKEDNTIEGRITKAMKEYAQKHFDNPKSLKEIASIEEGYIMDVRADVREILAESAKTDSIYHRELDNLNEKLKEAPAKLTKKTPDRSESGRIRGLSLMLEYSSWYYDNFNKIINISSLRNQYFNKLDSLVKHDSIYPITFYDINVRVKEKDDLKMKQYFTWICDTTTQIEIFDEPIKKSKFKKESDLLDESLKLLEYEKQRMEWVADGKRIFQDIELLFH